MAYIRNDMNLKLIGKRIRIAREQLRLTQEELALRVGKSQNAISAYEKGTRGIRIEELPELADALNVPIAYFFGDEYPDDEAIALLSELSPDVREEILDLIRFKSLKKKPARIV